MEELLVPSLRGHSGDFEAAEFSPRGPQILTKRKSLRSQSSGSTHSEPRARGRTFPRLAASFSSRFHLHCKKLKKTAFTAWSCFVIGVILRI